MRRLEQRQQRRQRPLVEVDDEMTERQKRDQLRVGLGVVRDRREESRRGGRGVGPGLRVSPDLPMLHYSAMDASSQRLTIRELGHVSLFVRDPEATRRFYRDTLGLLETGTRHGGRILLFSAGGRPPPP